MSRHRSRSSRLAAAMLVLGCTACTVGPTYRKPEVTVAEGWSPAAGRAFVQPEGSTAVARPFEGSHWWTVFDDPVLDRLMRLAFAQSLDVQTAGLRIAEARAQRESAAGAYYPNVAGSVVAGRARLSENGFTQNLAGGGSSGSGGSAGSSASSSGPSAAPTFNAFQVGFDALWELDLFGKTRRSVEAADAQIGAAEEARHDALVSLSAEVARTYFGLRGSERRLAIAQADLATQERLGKLVASRNGAGIVSASDTAAQTAQVASARAQLPPIEQAIAQARNRLALLLALAPGGVAEIVPASVALPPLPPQVPVGLPADLLRRRPDIRQREAELRAATAQIGVATAQLFPSVRLGLTGGLQSSRASSLFEWASRFLIGGTQVSIPVFQGGQLRAQVRIADLQAQEAVLAYRQAVLGAFHDVDNALIAYDGEQRRAAALKKQLDDAVRSRQLAMRRYEAGLAAYTDVLDAERSAHQTELGLAQSGVEASTNLVALFKALGGGWGEGSVSAAADGVDQRVDHRQ